MKRMIFFCLVIGAGLIALVFSIRLVDLAMERDGLKEQLERKNAMARFLESAANRALQTCELSKVDIEAIAAQEGYVVTWDNDVVNVGPFKVEAQSSCVKKITLVGR